MRKILTATYKTARRIVIAIVGTTLILIGIVMIVLPGPASIVIPAGLGILSLEFVWARRWLKKFKDTAQSAVDAVRKKKSKPDSNGQDGRSGGSGCAPDG